MEPTAVPTFDHPILLLDQRSRAHEAHLALEHVQELRQLVERAAPQQPADVRDARIVGDLEQALSGLILLLKLIPVSLGADVHRAELEHLEQLAVTADARLPE